MGKYLPALFTVIFGVILHYAIRWKQKKYDAFLAVAIPSTGTVISKGQGRSPTSNKPFFIRYGFLARDGRAYTGEERFSSGDKLDGYEEAQKINVLYNAEEPTDNAIEALYTYRVALGRKMRKWLPLVAGVLTLINLTHAL